ncbi:MbcA/ParS/Xre antitoxin family protein [Halomonas sp.]|uniref:MbcA/ParS/Xre antitoxin family protein n=1 Tax=Halomonas sp. TaxID=1486246 RepID=UPI00298EA844|nr:MbcA/ParS/Xre antitoxin family protein [Halomonas sp.]MDW7748897.1 MbcA/ParS/Xre antitoxin family protein [Halomonas sp.]
MTKRSDKPYERLRRSVVKYEAPLEPAAEKEDWAMLGTDESEEKIAIAIWRAAIEMFGGYRTAADRWLHHESMGLGWKRPIDVMQEDPQQLLDLIGRIEHGVYT